MNTLSYLKKRYADKVILNILYFYFLQGRIVIDSIIKT
jgi:hypothetical protein